MRSITAKFICTFVIMALMAGGIYWVATTPWLPQLEFPFTGSSSSTTSSQPGSSSTLSKPTDTAPQPSTTTQPPTSTAPQPPTTTAPPPTTTPSTIPHSHLYGPGWTSNSELHWNECVCGDRINVGPHIDNNINLKCDICNADVPPPPHEHDFGTAWISDETNHWHVCECGEIADLTPHADTDYNEKCDICDADIPHAHVFGTDWLSDDTNHWHTCPCGEKADLAPHADTDLNEKCDVCTAHVSLPPHEHSFNTVWMNDQNGHWQICDCGEKTNTVAHEDSDSNHLCDICGYVVSLPDPPKLNGHSAFIFDCASDQYLFKNQALDKTLYPASITKLFTCYVALMYLKDTSEIITLGEEQLSPAYGGFIEGDASQIWIDQGDKVSVDLLLHGTLMESGADAAYGLAAAAGYRILGNTNATAKEAVDAFMAQMNKLAQELGMDNTHFVTADGYHHADHKVSLKALVIIAKCAMNNEIIRDICAKPTATIKYTGASGKVYNKTLTNSNALIQSNSGYYIPYAVGLKTGYTSAAGQCFLGLFIHNGRCVIIGIFGCPYSDKGTYRWQDMMALWNYYLELDALT